MPVEKTGTNMALKSVSFTFIFILTCVKYVSCFQQTVDFEGLDCNKQFKVSKYDVFVVVAKPNPISIGNPDHCKVKFLTDGTFKIHVDTMKISDCAVTLNFYDSEPTEKYSKYSLSCQGSPEPVLTTNTGELIIRLDKPSGDTKGYQFQLKVTSGSEQSTGVGDTGGSGTGVQIGIGVGVAAFLIIIISIVCFFVCRQMRKEKQKPTQMQSSVFATASSRQVNGATNASSRDSGSFRTSGSYRVGFKGVSEEKSERSNRGPTSSKRGRGSQGYTNKAYSYTESSVAPSSRKSYANSMSTDGWAEDGKSYRMKEWSNENDQRRSSMRKKHENGSSKRDTAGETSFSECDETRSSVKFDMTVSHEKSDSKSKRQTLESDGKSDTTSRSRKEKESFPDKAYPILNKSKEDKNSRNSIKKIESEKQKMRDMSLKDGIAEKGHVSKRHGDRVSVPNVDKHDRYRESHDDKTRRQNDAFIKSDQRASVRSRTRSESRERKSSNYDSNVRSSKEYDEERQRGPLTNCYIDSEGRVIPRSKPEIRGRSQSESRYKGRQWYADKDFPPTSSASSSTSSKYYNRNDRDPPSRKHRYDYYDERDYSPHRSTHEYGNRRRSRSLSKSDRQRASARRSDSVRSASRDRHQSRSRDNYHYRDKYYDDHYDSEHSSRRPRSHSAPRRRHSSRSRTSRS